MYATVLTLIYTGNVILHDADYNVGMYSPQATAMTDS